MSGARQWGGDAREKDRKGRVDVSKVKRYRPGQAPEWMNGESDSDPDREDSESLLPLHSGASVSRRVNIAVEKRQPKQRGRRVVTPAVVSRSDHTTRPQEGKQPSQETTKAREARHGEARMPTVDMEAKRMALRQKLLEEQRAKSASPSSDEDDSEDDYTTESSDTGGDSEPIARPIFVRKDNRRTLDEREAIEREQLEKLEQEKIRAARQAQETRKIAAAKVAEELAQEAAARMGPKGAEDVVTDDEEDPEGDYNKWKERELGRLRRVLEEALRAEEEEKEKSAWKSMSDGEKERYISRKTKQAKIEARERSKQGPKRVGAFFQEETAGQR
jgi:microfibrillar-associated protein 1